jgi:phage FluMu protein Com
VELRCKHRTCRALLARVIGATLVCLDGTRVGPVAPGMVVARACPRCKASNRFWL